MRTAEAEITAGLRWRPELYWWSDMTDLHHNDVWVWRDSGSMMNFSAWSSEALPADPYYDCMQLTSAVHHQGLWQTFFCDTPYANTFSLCQLR